MYGPAKSRSLFSFIPEGSLSITSRNRAVAFRLTERVEDVLYVEPMSQDDALTIPEQVLMRVFVTDVCH